MIYFIPLRDAWKLRGAIKSPFEINVSHLSVRPKTTNEAIVKANKAGRICCVQTARYHPDKGRGCVRSGLWKKDSHKYWDRQTDRQTSMASRWQKRESLKIMITCEKNSEMLFAFSVKNKHRINKWQNQAKKRAENVTAILISRWNGGEDVITVEELLNYSSC